ncbi:MAG TPA: ANTAR domain-containing protein [Actinomycetospora sp.]|jgi:hypothetical protein|uniref:ANTAR domain-containing protein n=1 Tax=Actinomycetospora sp. TaxID=1872135 RepID=UPI002F3E3BB3
MSHHLDALAALTRIEEFVASTERTRSAEDRDLPALLHALLGGALETLPDAREAGILERSPRGVLSRAGTDPVIEELERLGADLGEGPVLAAGTHATSATAAVTALDSDASHRWPRWVAAARAAGFASTLAMALPVEAGKRPTVLTFYGARADGFGQTDVEAAQTFAAPIAVTLQAIDRAESLQRAVASRDVIGQAKGMLMERHGLTAAAAFDRLVRISQQSNVRLVDVATWLVGRCGTGSPDSGEQPATGVQPATAAQPAPVRLPGPRQRVSASGAG